MVTSFASVSTPKKEMGITKESIELPNCLETMEITQISPWHGFSEKKIESFGPITV
jgi:hypothetical protein